MILSVKSSFLTVWYPESHATDNYTYVNKLKFHRSQSSSAEIHRATSYSAVFSQLPASAEEFCRALFSSTEIPGSLPGTVELHWLLPRSSDLPWLCSSLLISAYLRRAQRSITDVSWVPPCSTTLYRVSSNASELHKYPLRSTELLYASRRNIELHHISMLCCVSSKCNTLISVKYIF